MPRIVPLQLLKCLKVLLDENGGILSESEVKRIAGLMTKYSKKLVSKCIYVQILKCTKTELLGEFMGAGGWSLTHMWLNDAIRARNWPLVQEILELLLLCPVDVERLKSNSAPKLVKGLCKDGDDEGVRILASKLVEQWLKVVTGDVSASSSPAQMTPKPSEGPSMADAIIASNIAPIKSNSVLKPSSQIEEDPLGQAETPIATSFLPTSAQKKASESGLILKCIVKDGKQVWERVESSQKNQQTVEEEQIEENKENPEEEGDEEEEEEDEVEEEEDDEAKSVNEEEEVPVVEGSTANSIGEGTTDNKENEVVLKRKDDKEKVPNEKEKEKESEKEKEKDKDKDKIKSTSSSDKDKKSSHKSSSSSHKSSSSSKNSSGSSSKSKTSSSSSSRRSSTDSKSRSKDKDKDKEKEKEREKDKDKERSSSNKDRSSDKDKYRSSSYSKSSSSSSNKDKDRHRDKSSSSSSTKKEKTDSVTQAEKDKETLSKLTAPSLDKLGKIPKRPKSETEELKPTSITIPSKKASMSIEIRRDSEKAKTVKTYKSQFRSHGLTEEAPPPPSRKGLKKPNSAPIPGTTIISSLSLKRPSPPPSSLSTSLNKDAPAEKKPKIDMNNVSVPVEKVGAIKLIPPKKNFERALPRVLLMIHLTFS